jgi:hypothetical protein
MVVDSVAGNLNDMLSLLAAATISQTLFSDDFEDWAADWQATDEAAWQVKSTPFGKVLALKKQSKYQPPHRSPHNIALIKSRKFGSFQATVLARSTKELYGHRDLCLFFGYQDPAHFYYVHFGQQMDPRANQIFIVNGADRIKISTKTTDGTPWDHKWHKLRLIRDLESGSIQVFFDDMSTPWMTATDKTFGAGRFGLGSFDDTGEFDDLVIVRRL